MILMPYFLSNSITEAITTDEQSVSGMKPIFTSFFSGASDPAAQAPTRTASGTRLMRALAPVALRNCRLRIASPFPKKKAPAPPPEKRGADAFVGCGGTVASRSVLKTQSLCHGLAIDFLAVLGNDHALMQCATMTHAPSKSAASIICWATSPRRVLRHHHEVLEHVAARRIGIDDDDVGPQLFDGPEKRERRGELSGDCIAGKAQRVTNGLRALSRLVDDKHPHARTSQVACQSISPGKSRRWR